MCVSVYIYMFPVQSLCAETQNATVWSKEMLIDWKGTNRERGRPRDSLYPPDQSTELSLFCQEKGKWDDSSAPEILQWLACLCARQRRRC